MVPVKLGYVFCSLLPWIFLCAFSHFFSNVLNLLQRLPLNQKLHWEGPQGRGGSFLGLYLPKIAVFSGCWDGDRKMLNEKLTVSLKCQRAAVWCAKQLKKKRWCIFFYVQGFLSPKSACPHPSPGSALGSSYWWQTPPLLSYSAVFWVLLLGLFGDLSHMHKYQSNLLCKRFILLYFIQCLSLMCPGARSTAFGYMERRLCHQFLSPVCDCCSLLYIPCICTKIQLSLEYHLSFVQKLHPNILGMVFSTILLKCTQPSKGCQF